MNKEYAKNEDCQCSLCQRHRKFYSITKQLPESDKQWMEGFYEAVFDEEEEHSMLKAHYEEITKPPAWLPISQCDLKPGEPFWYFIERNNRVSFSQDGQNVHLGKNTTITYFMRALPPYAIPKPSVVEKESDGFEEWRKSKGYPANCESTYWRPEAWLASRAALDKGKEGK